MRVNHLIIGCDNVNSSRDFYVNILGFRHHDSFIDTGTKSEGQVLVLDQKDELEILLVPFRQERLPSPQHLAFEVQSDKFEQIRNAAEKEGMTIRMMPPLDSKMVGIGVTEVRGKKFERFYLLDPSRVNIEIMRLC